MKLTNDEIFAAREPLQKLMEQKFPVLTSYKLAKLASKLNDQMRIIEEVRQKLVTKYGTQDGPNPRSLKVEPDSENFPAFVEEFNELMAIEMDIAIEKVALPEKTSTTCDACQHTMNKPLEIEPGILMALEKFIEVEKPQEYVAIKM